jgi:DnaD/phage-associated family protein|nr:MAG TPA: Putative primosome component [Caudoviricetes sp.]
MDLREKSPESIVLRFVWLESLTQDYTNEEIGLIVRDLYSYADRGIEPSQYADRGMRGLWRSMKDGVDKDFSKYREKSKKNSDAAKARWEKQMQKESSDGVCADADALLETQMDANASERMHLHPTYTSTSTITATDIPPTAADSRTDLELSKIVQHYQRAIGDFPRSALDKLQKWRETFPADVLCAAFDEAAEAGHRAWKYVDGILKGWQTDGVRTLGDVAARREARKKPGTPPEKEWGVLT